MWVDTLLCVICDNITTRGYSKWYRALGNVPIGIVDPDLDILELVNPW